MTKVDQIKTTNAADKKIVHQRYISCDGGVKLLGHPKIYMEIKLGEHEISCPYCGKEFVYIEDQFNGR